MPVEPKIQLRALGGSEALKILQGIDRKLGDVGKAAQKAAKEQERAAKVAQAEQKKVADAAQRAAAAQQKAAEKASAAHQKASAEAARAAERAQAKIERAAQKEAERWQRMAQESQLARIRALEKVTLAAQREAAKQAEIAKRTAAAEVKARQDALRKAGGLVTAGTAAVLAGATVAAGTARSISGVKDIRERITSGNEFRERLVLTTSQAGMSGQQREAVQGQVLSASTATGKDVGELMSVLETGQAQFNNLKFFADNLKEIATISKAAGADTGEFATALGFVQKAFDLSGEEAMEAAYLMKASADKGSVELKDFARDFASAAGGFKMSTGMTGMEGVRQFLGAAQGVATGGFGSAESSTRMTQAVGYLNREEVQKGLREELGITDIRKNGKIDVATVIDQLGSNRKFADSPTVRQKIFHDAQAREGIEALIEARRRVQEGRTGAVDLRSVAGVDATAGREAVATTMTSMQGEGFFQMQKEAARMQAETIENLKTYNDQILLVVGAADRLESSFGSLSQWASSIASIGVAGALTNLVTGRLGGGGGGGGGGGVPGTVPVPGGSSGRGAGIGGKLLRTAGWTALAYAGYQLGEAGIGAADDYVKDKTGKGIGDRLFGHQNRGEQDAYLTRTLNESGGGTAPVTSTPTAPAPSAALGDEKLLQAIFQMNRDVNRNLQQIDNGLRVPKPAAGAAREPR